MIAHLQVDMIADFNPDPDIDEGSYSESWTLSKDIIQTVVAGGGKGTDILQVGPLVEVEPYQGMFVIKDVSQATMDALDALPSCVVVFSE